MGPAQVRAPQAREHIQEPVLPPTRLSSNPSPCLTLWTPSPETGTHAGITRLQRWHRAEQMGLKPPPEVRQVLQSHPGDPRFQCSLWHFYPL
ncbi:DNA polymerase delta subunit 4 isoform X2 [Ovis aries]|uniref:DNA polymerase delta 4, accessory subunit n=1 Tax=Ovis aries TaxID=9940 RepID=A0AC11BFJ9_SHEEP|nr:DNA polymerase delta subunit 4 isoform X2 [Ovis aries]